MKRPPRWPCPPMAVGLALLMAVLALPSLADVARRREALQAFTGGDYRRAAALLEAEVAELKRVRGERDPETLGEMFGLAAAYGRLGRMDEQLALSEQVYRLRREVLEPGHPDIAESAGNLAAAYLEAGRPADGLAMNQAWLQALRRQQPLDEREQLRALNNLAVIYGELGREAEAQALHEQMVERATRLMGRAHPWTLRSMGNVAAGHRHAGRLPQALALQQEVWQVRRQARGERHPETLESMLEVGRSLRELGRLEEALAVLEPCHAGLQAALGERHAATLGAHLERGIAASAAGRSDGPALLQQAQALHRQVLGDRHEQTLRATRWLAWAWVVAGRPTEAAALSEAFVGSVEWLRSQPGLATEDRQSRFADWARDYRIFAVAHGEAGQAQRGLHLAELGKARTLLDAMAARHAERFAGVPAASLQRLDTLARRIAQNGQLAADASDPLVRAELEARRNELVQQHAVLQQQLKARHPAYARLSEVTLVGQGELRGLVPADAVFIHFLWSVADQLGAFVISADGEPRYVPLGRQPGLADAVEIVRMAQASPAALSRTLAQQGRRAWRLTDGSYRLLDRALPGPAGATELSAPDAVARHLEERLLKPLAPTVGGSRRWIISPDGPLAQLAFEALPHGPAQEPLAAHATVHYAHSLSSYALGQQLQKRYAGLQGRRSLLAMGHAQYRPAPGTEAERRALARSTDVTTSAQLKDLDGHWSDLPGTEVEVKAVAGLFPDASVYTGALATEQQLQALNAKGQLRQYRYLLLSAHGYLSSQRPALSAIVLGLRQRTPEADGYVTAAEWPGYDLRSDLTMLSACDSGVGSLVVGEGVMGLPHAMFLAGNVNTVLTLWPVDDEATAEFVTGFFRRLKAGQPAAQALAATKRDFLRHPKYAHPAYWAPFVLVGAG